MVLVDISWHFASQRTWPIIWAVKLLVHFWRAIWIIGLLDRHQSHWIESVVLSVFWLVQVYTGINWNLIALFPAIGRVCMFNFELYNLSLTISIWIHRIMTWLVFSLCVNNLRSSVIYGQRIVSAFFNFSWLNEIKRNNTILHISCLFVINPLKFWVSNWSRLRPVLVHYDHRDDDVLSVLVYNNQRSLWMSFCFLKRNRLLTSLPCRIHVRLVKRFWLNVYWLSSGKVHFFFVFLLLQGAIVGKRYCNFFIFGFGLFMWNNLLAVHLFQLERCKLSVAGGIVIKVAETWRGVLSLIHLWVVLASSF